MNHQIQHYIDIERPGGEHAQAVDLKKHRPSDDRQGGADCRIEALQMSDLHDAFMLLCQADQLLGFTHRGRHWFLDQDVDSCLHEFLGRAEMVNRGNRDRGRLDFAVRGEQLIDRTKSPAAEFPRNRVCSVGVESTTPTNRTGAPSFASCWYTRAWLRPKAPTPTTAT